MPVGTCLRGTYRRASSPPPERTVLHESQEEGPDQRFVFAHTEYDFSDENVGFEVFRFENGQAVEHWDNIQSRMGPNPSGHTMTDDPTQATDLDRTEANRQTLRAFVDEVLINRRLDRLENYVDRQSYTEYSPQLQDGFDHLAAGLFQSTTTTILPRAWPDPAWAIAVPVSARG